MHKQTLVLAGFLLLSVTCAQAQRINLNITQREDGGEGIEVTRQLPDDTRNTRPTRDTRDTRDTNNTRSTRSTRPAPRQIQYTSDMPRSWRQLDAERLTAFQTAREYSEMVSSDIKANGYISPQTISAYCNNGYQVINLPAEKYVGYPEENMRAAWLFLRCGSMPICLPLKVQGALDRIKAIQGETPGILRYELFWKMLISDKRGVDRAMTKLTESSGEKYGPWLEYMTRLTPLTGQNIDLQLRLKNGQTLDTTARSAKVLLFRNTDATGQKVLSSLYQRYGKIKQIAIIDAPATPDTPATPGTPGTRRTHRIPQLAGDQTQTLLSNFKISNLPTAVVLDYTSRVMYAGDAGAWECDRAIHHAANARGEPVYITAKRELPDEPDKPTPAQEAAAKKMCDAAWDRSRLGIKTNTPAIKEQAIQEFRECIRLYPRTRAADEARANLRDMGVIP